jgi:5'-methylthioadenosine phosphorylase
LTAKIGIIGGSGLYSMPGFEAQHEVAVDTPWGAPSDSYIVGKLAGKDVAFLAAARPGPSHLALGIEFSAPTFSGLRSWAWSALSH